MPLDTSNLSTDQRGAVLEVLRAVLLPEFELMVVRDQSLNMVLSLLCRRGVPGRRLQECAIEMILCGFEEGRRCPQQPLRPLRGFEGGAIVPGKEASLELSAPIPAFGKRKIRVTGQMTLHLKLVKVPIVEATECRGSPAERSYQPELCSDDVSDEAKLRPSREPEATLGLALHLGERITRREKIRIQLVAAVGSVSEISGQVGGLESAAQEIAASPDMVCPRH